MTTCIKCGGMMGWPKYHRAPKIFYGCLVYTCRTCGYEAMTPTRDNQPHGEFPKDYLISSRAGN